MKYRNSIMALLFLLSVSVSTHAAEPTGSEKAAWLPSLQTESPEAGFELAVKLSRKTVKTIQPEVEVLKKLRPAYSHDPDSLIAASHVVATYYRTIAEANNYWKD